MAFTYCNGYRCGKKGDCLRNKRHLELLVKKSDTRKLSYVESTLCVRHRHNNFVPIEVYGKEVSNGKGA